ncbi:NAD-dependent epimerase/dehydratase family protein [Streptomyces sp. NPDC057148]|uniref:NAD-dependent epimerase/dehydratase family protein n=1 Tax=unclassified Streptomyces TaxID=2593676 RepID=UPI00362E0779
MTTWHRPGGDQRRVAVLGGTGWVGRHVVSAAAARGHHVLVAARHPAQHVRSHAFVSLDLARATEEHLTALLVRHRITAVVNATDAANATDGWDRTDHDLHAMNVTAVHRLVAAMGALPWRSRLVHIGTLHEYGDVPAETLIDESVPPRPAGAYARTKLEGSQAVLDALRAGRVDGLVLRAANVCGPHPSPASFPGKLVGMLRGALAAGEPMRVLLTPARRDFVDVRDLADAVVRAVTSPATGHVLNIGSGTAVDMRTLVRLFVTAAGHSTDLIEERTRDVPSLGGTWTKADIRLAGRLLDWRPRVRLVDSLAAMWAGETTGGPLRREA